MSARGYVVWEGASPIDGAPIVMVVTLSSANRKTGNMVQSWILRSDMSPVEAMRQGKDASICGTCPLQGRQIDGKRVGRACYVNVGQAPSSVWRTFKAGGYERLAPAIVGRLIAGRAVRLGAYGDPGLVPVEVLASLVMDAARWTGYTHAWRFIDPAYANLLMASADSVADRRAARKLGYRSFYVMPAHASLAGLRGVMECASTRERNPLQCADCGACAGTRNGAASKAVDVVILAHGTGARYVS